MCFGAWRHANGQRSQPVAWGASSHAKGARTFIADRMRVIVVSIALVLGAGAALAQAGAAPPAAPPPRPRQRRLPAGSAGGDAGCPHGSKPPAPRKRWPNACGCGMRRRMTKQRVGAVPASAFRPGSKTSRIENMDIMGTSLRKKQGVGTSRKSQLRRLYGLGSDWGAVPADRSQGSAELCWDAAAILGLCRFALSGKDDAQARVHGLLSVVWQACWQTRPSLRAAELLMFDDPNCSWCRRWTRRDRPGLSAAPRKGSRRRCDASRSATRRRPACRSRARSMPRPTFVLVEDGQEVGRDRRAMPGAITSIRCSMSC